jgi:hypothetical protein
MNDAQLRQEVMRGQQRWMKRIVDHEVGADGELGEGGDVAAEVDEGVAHEAAAGATDTQTMTLVELHAKAPRQDDTRRTQRSEEIGAGLLGGDDVDLDAALLQQAAQHMRAHQVATRVGEGEVNDSDHAVTTTQRPASFQGGIGRYHRQFIAKIQ